MSLFAVHYSYDSDTALLGRHRPAHREFLRGLLSAGLVAAGAYPEAEEPGALLIVEAESQEAVESMLDDDPFMAAGAITTRRVQRWDPPIGMFS